MSVTCVLRYRGDLVFQRNLTYGSSKHCASSGPLSLRCISLDARIGCDCFGWGGGDAEASRVVAVCWHVHVGKESRNLYVSHEHGNGRTHSGGRGYRNHKPVVPGNSSDSKVLVCGE